MTAPPAALAARPGLRMLNDSSVARTELVTPGMCGPNSLFAGQLGDWTWDAVSAVCGINAYDARDPAGAPTYLSFYYFHIRGSQRMHPLRITFGDRLQVVSRVFASGSESVLTLHSIRYDDGSPAVPFEPVDFYRYDDQDCLYVENVNRWIARSRPHSNQDLVRSSPAAFRYQHLPTLPGRYSPRLAYAHARTHGTFLDQVPDHTPAAAQLTVDYPVEVSRDLNAVGLLYFASYFSILDWALLRLWRHLGRSDQAYLRRTVLDQRLCYLGNADPDAVVRVTLTLWRSRSEPSQELVDAVLRDRDNGGVLAVAALQVHSPEPVS